MNSLIIYGSQYGTTERYAKRFSEIVHFPAVTYESVNDLAQYGQIVYFGALYAGGIKGLRKIIKILPNGVKLMIVTVGLADVHDKENINNIRKAMAKQVPENIMKSADIFHLRGGIDYQKLSFRHKTMMTLLYHKAKGLPEDKKTAEVNAMIETFNSKVDFVDYVSLAPVIEAFQQKLDF
ncbi:MAG TPA: flavodoxin domain-containing protein [Candidatus Blautia intestinipullorum]|nr:flavodoxin domain-containing protein [Candidatus Blautia intestinipullorum]